MKSSSSNLPRVQPVLRTVGDGSSAMTSFLKALNDPSFSDVKFILDDSKEYYAHRCILAARSSAFRAMLFGVHNEAREAEIRVHDIDSGHFYTILEWAYTGTATVSAAEVLGVMKLANFYLFQDLEKLCRDQAMRFIDVGNVFILLNSALENTEDDVVSKCLEFLKSHVSEAIETPSWFELCSTGVQDVLAMQQMDVSEYVLYQRTLDWIDHHATDEQHRVALLTSFLPRVRLSQLSVNELLNNVKPVVNGYGVQQREYVEALEFKLAPEHFRSSKTLDRLCPRLPTLLGRISMNVPRRFLNGWRNVIELDASKPLPLSTLVELQHTQHAVTFIAVGECVGHNLTLLAVGNADVALRKVKSQSITAQQDGSVYWFGYSSLALSFGFSPTADHRVTYDVTQSDRDRKFFWEVADMAPESPTSSPSANLAAGGCTRFIFVK